MVRCIPGSKIGKEIGDLLLATAKSRFFGCSRAHSLIKSDKGTSLKCRLYPIYIFCYESYWILYSFVGDSEKREVKL